MTDPTLARIPTLHDLAARPDGQKSLSRRTTSAIGVVVVHIILLLIFWIKPISPVIEAIPVPLETIVYLSAADRDTSAPPAVRDREEPKGNGMPLSTAPLLIPPPQVNVPSQADVDAEIMGGLGRALACTAGKYEYLAESARRNCDVALVPWKFGTTAEIMARQIKPTDPNVALAPIGGADTNRQINSTADPCVGLENSPIGIDACRRINPKGTGIQPGKFGIQF